MSIATKISRLGEVAKAKKSKPNILKMKTTQQIAKAIDLQRIKSIIEDEPAMEKRQEYCFDLPIMETEFKLIKKIIK